MNIKNCQTLLIKLVLELMYLAEMTKAATSFSAREIDLHGRQDRPLEVADHPIRLWYSKACLTTINLIRSITSSYSSIVLHDIRKL